VSLLKQVIIVNAYPKSGKTTFELFIAQYQATLIRSSIDCVKELAKKYFGWNGIKDEETRKFLSDMKRMFSEEFDIVYSDISKTIQRFYRDTSLELLMIDSREPAEIERFKNQFHAITVFVQRDDCEKLTSNESDANVENYKYDFYINNNGTLEDLEQQAIEFINKLKLMEK
jgi:dephospho-CoA kinase